jgi:hypothetical protein
MRTSRRHTIGGRRRCDRLNNARATIFHEDSKIREDHEDVLYTASFVVFVLIVLRDDPSSEDER